MGKNNEETTMRPIRKRVKIDLQEFGGTGEMILEELSAKRRMDMNDDMGMCTIVDPRTKTASTRVGTQMAYYRTAFIVQAPYMSSPTANTLDNWVRFLDRFPDHGNALCNRIDAVIAEIESDRNTPLAESGQAETPK